jgi:hypothetical protein
VIDLRKIKLIAGTQRSLSKHSTGIRNNIQMDFLYVLAIIFVVYGISFAMINIRHIFTGKEFRGTCATNNPMLKNQIGECQVCGSKPGEDCQNPEKDQNKGLSSMPSV